MNRGEFKIKVNTEELLASDRASSHYIGIIS